MSENSPRIHPTAVISPRAQLAEGVEIGPFVVVGDEVSIGAGTVVGPSCLLEGPTVIGRNNRLVGHASIGTAPQDLKFKGELTTLTIGDNNQIREFVTMNRGTGGGHGETRVGSNNLFMVGTHIAHDCIVGNDIIMANTATLAGHVEVEDGATVGASCGIHQFCRIGAHAFVGAYSVVTRDALPFVKTVGFRGESKIYGINSIGLERKGFSKDRLEALNRAYRTLFRKKLLLKEAVETIRAEGAVTEDVRLLLDFIESSDRGFVR